MCLLTSNLDHDVEQWPSRGSRQLFCCESSHTYFKYAYAQIIFMSKISLRQSGFKKDTLFLVGKDFSTFIGKLYINVYLTFLKLDRIEEL